MSDLASGDRYLTRPAQGETSSASPSLGDVLSECPAGYHLHSVVPIASGSGYTASFVVIFERDEVDAKAQAERRKK